MKALLSRFIDLFLSKKNFSRRQKPGDLGSNYTTYGKFKVNLEDPAMIGLMEEYYNVQV